jgi:hypothetical protein
VHLQKWQFLSYIIIELIDEVKDSALTGVILMVVKDLRDIAIASDYPTAKRLRIKDGSISSKTCEERERSREVTPVIESGGESCICIHEKNLPSLNYLA